MHPPQPICVGGVVVCGGKSSRMGRAKAWLNLGPETFLQRVVRTLSEVVSPIVVVAAVGQDLPALPTDVEIVRDEFEGKGPLAGLATGLRTLCNRCEAVYASSTDVPLLRAGFVRAVIDQLGEADFVLPREGKFHHPLAGCYRVSLEPIVRGLVERDRLRPVFCLTKRGAWKSTWNDCAPPIRIWTRCGTVTHPEEYAELLHRWECLRGN